MAARPLARRKIEAVPLQHEAAGQRIERIGRAAKLGAGDGEGIYKSIRRQSKRAAAQKLRVDEAAIELGVVGHERRIGEEIEKLLQDRGKERLIGEKGAGEAVNAHHLLRHVALGIEVAVEMAPGRHKID